MYDFSNISFADKKSLVSKIFMTYKKLNSVRQYFSQRQKTEGIDVKFLNDSLEKSTKVVSMFDTIISLLKDEHLMILEKEFLENSPQNWYEEFWSKTTYYRLKHDALNDFLFLFFF